MLLASRQEFNIQLEFCVHASSYVNVALRLIKFLIISISIVDCVNEA